MVTKAELVAIARKCKLPLGMMEKDFILTRILREICSSKFKDTLIFKGGTALHMLYLHKRLSVDLDFTALNEVDTDALKSLLVMKEITSEIRSVKTFENSIAIDLKYKSLLNYPDSIKLDISLREKPLLELKGLALKSPYFQDFRIKTFQIEEMAAEKLRALIQRKRPRDYFDMWLLLEKITFESFEKLAEKKLIAVNDTFDISRVFNDLDIVRSLWKIDLQQLVSQLPEFDTVVSELRKKLYFCSEVV